MARNRGRDARMTRWVMIGLPYLWLLIFFLAPFAIVLKLSFSEMRIAQPPYGPTWDSWEGITAYFSALNFENYAFIFDDPLYLNSYLNSLQIAAISTVLTLAIGYPMAYAIARAPANWRGLLLMLVILPFWTSFLIRVYAWIGILKPEGLLNLALVSVGLIDPEEPLRIYNTVIAVYIGIVYSYLPFMVLPLYANLSKLDPALLEASADLGARPLTAFWRVTLPLSLPGVAAGCFLVFIPAVGEFVIPTLLGGADTVMIGRTMYDEFFSNRDWPLASAVAVLLLLVLIAPIVLFQRAAAQKEVGG